MIAEYVKQAQLPLWVGFLGAATCRISSITVHRHGLMHIISTVAWLGCVVLFMWGCSLYAKAKGQSPWFGLLGLLSLIGCIILAVLPDKYKDGVVVDPNLPQTPTMPPPPPYHQAEPTDDARPL